MYRRMLFVGLGGSGGKTLRFMKAGLNEWLERHGWTEGIPVGFQFAHIDTPTEPDGKDVGDSSLISAEEYLGLVGKGITYETVASHLDRGPSPQLNLAGWRVEPNNLMVSIQDGAGQFRAVGRSIGAAYLRSIRSFLEKSIERLNSVDAQPQLNKLYTHVTKKVPGGGTAGQSEPFVVIVSSLAGGTGAGILMDTCDTLRLLEPTWGHHSFALLYTPEVFANLPPLQRDGVAPNSLAAICELSNGSWYQPSTQIGSRANGSNLPSLAPRLPGFFEDAGFGTELRRSGPAYPLLVGLRSSTGAAYQDEKELFRMVGQSMVAWATDTLTQDGLLAYLKANWQSSANANSLDIKGDVLVNTGAGEQGVPNISGIGFARISIGIKQFEEYASRRIARDAAEWVARYHTNSDEAQAIQSERQTLSPEYLAGEIAKRHFDWFISQCRLQERGPDQNDILDALKPEGIDQLQRDTKARIKASLSQTEEQSARDWEPLIVTAVQNYLVEYERDWAPDLNAAFEAWAATVPERVLGVVRESVANFGTAVTSKLIELLIHELENEAAGVAVELLGRTELGKYAQWTSRDFWSGRIKTALVEAGGGRLEADDPAIDKAISEGFGAARFTYMVPTCERASLMLREFCAGFLQPLRKKVGDATDDLRQQLIGVPGWPGWPEPGEPQEVPKDLRPGAAERTLLPVEKFPELFTKNLAIHFGRDVTEDAQSRRELRHDVISGSFIDKKLKTSAKGSEKLLPFVAIQVSGAWRPSSAVIGGARASEPVRLTVRFNVTELLGRAREWLKNGDGVFPSLLSSNLREFTDPGTTFAPAFGLTLDDFKERRERFEEVLGQAIGLSDPLVGLDPNLLQVLHERARSPYRRFSQIPFGGDHKLGPRVIEVLTKVTTDDNAPKPESLLTQDSSLTHIDLYSFLPAPHSPLVIRSLMEPIGQEWARITAAKDKKDRVSTAISNFWFYRRTRPLMEFIPAPRPHIYAMIRGWYVGLLLGLIDREVEDRPVSITDPEDVNLLQYEFPYPTLTPMSDDNPASLLESLSLAYVKVGVDDEIKPLYPYVLLRRFGTQSPRESLLNWGDLNELCRTLLREGVVPGSTPELMLIPEISGEDLTPSERGSIVVNVLSEIRAEFVKDYKVWKHETEASPSRLSQPPLWPSIWYAMDRSLTQLIQTFKVEGAEKGKKKAR